MAVGQCGGSNNEKVLATTRVVTLSFGSLNRLLLYTLRHFPFAYTGFILSLVSVVIELAAVSAIFPLAEAASGRGIPHTSFWPRVLGFVGISPELSNLLTLFLVLLTLRALTLFASNAIVTYTGRQLIAHFSSQAFATFIRTLTFAEVNQRSIGYFINLAGDEAYRASHIVVALGQLCPSIVLVFIYFSAIAYQSIAVAVGVTLFLGLAGVSLIGAFRRSHRLGTIMTEQARGLGSHFLDSLNSLRSVRALTAEEFVAHRYRQMLKEYARTGFAVDWTNLLARYIPVLALLSMGLGWAFFQTKSSVGAENLPFLFMLLLLLLRFFPVVGEVVNTCLRVVSDLRAGHDISHVLERSHELHTGAFTGGSQVTTVDKITSIEFCGVGFSYPDGREILKGVDFTLEAGHSYSLSGPSGTGKSTIVDLLLGFYQLQHGVIKINGYNHIEIDPRVLRSKIVVLEQQARVFNDTIYNNIAFGRQTDLDAVRNACRLACIDEDIGKLTERYDTTISYQGGNLSGGQRQRIGIARGLLGGGDVLILDESTNALDEHTKQSLVGNILSAYRNRIILFVTHDPAIAKRVDVVLDLATMNQCEEADSSSPREVAKNVALEEPTFVQWPMED